LGPWAEIDSYFEYMAPLTKPMDRFWLARHMGLLHKQRNDVLDHAVLQAATWFSAHGGKLKQVGVPISDEEMSSIKVAFRFVRPQVPRPPGHRTTRKQKRGRSRYDLSSSMGRSHGPRRAPAPVIRDQNDINEYLALVEKAAGEE
jgi:hypothetical protein